MAIFLGIDGGGSKTTCVIGDESSVLGRGSGGPSNIVRIGEKVAKESLEAAIRQACTVANVSPHQIKSSCVGTAGAELEDVRDKVRKVVSQIVSGEVEVVGDVVVALQAALGDGPGVNVIAGTGSVAYGRNAAGKTARAGGWGYAVSDEGSGHWIGHLAVASVLRACDEGEDPPLLHALMKSLSVNTRDQFVIAVNTSPPPNFASLMPVVLVASDAGDTIAREALGKAGEVLARLASTVVRRLFDQGENCRVAMTGGVFTNSALVRQVFYNKLRAEIPNIALTSTVAEPVNGALALARKAGTD